MIQPPLQTSLCTAYQLCPHTHSHPIDRDRRASTRPGSQTIRRCTNYTTHTTPTTIPPFECSSHLSHVSLPILALDRSVCRQLARSPPRHSHSHSHSHSPDMYAPTYGFGQGTNNNAQQPGFNANVPSAAQPSHFFPGQQPQQMMYNSQQYGAGPQQNPYAGMGVNPAMMQGGGGMAHMSINNGVGTLHRIQVIYFAYGFPGGLKTLICRVLLVHQLQYLGRNAAIPNI